MSSQVSRGDGQYTRKQAIQIAISAIRGMSILHVGSDLGS